MAAFPDSSTLEEAAIIVAGLRSNSITDSSLSSASSAAASGSEKRVGDIGDVTFVTAAKSTNNNYSEPPKRAKSSNKKKQQPSQDADGGAPAKKPKAIKPPPMDATGLVFAQPELKPHPFFYYSDHSLEHDDDPLTPITAAGIVPTFPAKMHAILANPELADVVGWDPHGRSWRILKPRDFEIRILPRYFEHSKFSSFVRQANGWGFRRMSEGPDKNAYYHEYFLRAMPWLCKKMRRPKVAEKKAIDPEMEPDLNAISLLFPVPDRPPTSEILVLQKTIETGPRARMPVVWDLFNSADYPPSAASQPVGLSNPDNVEDDEGGPVDATLKRSNASYGDLKPAAVPTPVVAPVAAVRPPSVPATLPSQVAVTTVLNLDSLQRTNHVPNIMPQTSRDTLLHTMESPTHPPPSLAYHGDHQPSALSSDSQIAASFVAASAIHAHHLRIMLSNAFVAGVPVSEAVNQAMPYAAAATAARMGVGHHHGVSGMGQMSHYLQAQQSQHFSPRSFSNTSYVKNGVTNTENSLSPEMIQRLRQLEAYRAARGDNSHFRFHPGGL
ncbi:hypothetical protein ACHAXH_005191 [Discostella pseudostelligera]